jgi:hypothetical protein
MRPGERVITADGSMTHGTVVRVQGGRVEVEFKGGEWFYPYRAWFELRELLPHAHYIEALASERP